MINALIIDVKDNVVAIEQIAKGTEIAIKQEIKFLHLLLFGDIQIYHKFATRYS